MAETPKAKKEPMARLNTRIPQSYVAYVRSEVKKSKGTSTEGDVYRELLGEAISNRIKK